MQRVVVLHCMARGGKDVRFIKTELYSNRQAMYILMSDKK